MIQCIRTKIKLMMLDSIIISNANFYSTLNWLFIANFFFNKQQNVGIELK